jgi:hypothetical protein
MRSSIGESKYVHKDGVASVTFLWLLWDITLLW